MLLRRGSPLSERQRRRDIVAPTGSTGLRLWNGAGLCCGAVGSLTRTGDLTDGCTAAQVGLLALYSGFQNDSSDGSNTVVAWRS